MNTKPKTLRNLLIFSVVAISCGWIGVGINHLLNQPSNLESLGALIFITTPLLCVILLHLFGSDDWKDMPFRIDFKKNAIWYLFALLVYPIVITITLLIGKILGWVDVSKFNFVVFLPILAAAILPNIIKNFFEESVWRGYLTIKLQQLTKNEWLIYFIVAIVWQSWHAPYYLVFLEERYLAQFFPYGGMWALIYGFLILIVWTIMYTEVFFLSKSLWVVILMHTIEDALNSLISEGFVVIDPAKTLLISPTFGIMPLTIYLLIGLSLRKVRKKNIQANYC